MSFWCCKNLDGKPAEPMRPDESNAPADGILDIDGEIVAEEGWFTPEGAVVAKGFRQRLAQYRNVTVRINSPGGDVMAGAEIYSALKEHSLNGHGKVRVEITALAASAASVIAMAGDEIAMYPTSYMMIHNPWTIAAGDAKDLRKAARTLDVISEGLINAYQQRTGKGRDELKRMLEAETWMSAGTCVSEGFADEIIGAEAGAAAACLMSGRSHGAEEILKRYAAQQKAEEPEETEEPEKPDEETEEEEERPENRGKNAEPEEEPGADPEREEEEKPNEPEEPETEETEPDGEAEEPEDPEEAEDPENPEKPEKPEKPEEDRKRDILRRAAVIAGWAETVVSMTRGGEA